MSVGDEFHYAFVFGKNFDVEERNGYRIDEDVGVEHTIYVHLWFLQKRKTFNLLFAGNWSPICFA
jgi:hypothetical protein